jgi:hypothetical protein
VIGQPLGSNLRNNLRRSGISRSRYLNTMGTMSLASRRGIGDDTESGLDVLLFRLISQR